VLTDDAENAAAYADLAAEGVRLLRAETSDRRLTAAG
jgi:hypothetical protein